MAHLGRPNRAYGPEEVGQFFCEFAILGGAAGRRVEAWAKIAHVQHTVLSVKDRHVASPTGRDDETFAFYEIACCFRKDEIPGKQNFRRCRDGKVTTNYVLKKNWFAYVYSSLCSCTVTIS